MRNLSRNLAEYLSTNVHAVDPLIKMAVAHYQLKRIVSPVEGLFAQSQTQNVHKVVHFW